MEDASTKTNYTSNTNNESVLCVFQTHTRPITSERNYSSALVNTPNLRYWRRPILLSSMVSFRLQGHVQYCKLLSLFYFLLLCVVKWNKLVRWTPLSFITVVFFWLSELECYKFSCPSDYERQIELRLSAHAFENHVSHQSWTESPETRTSEGSGNEFLLVLLHEVPNL